MKSITSRENPWFKRIREAIRDHESEIAIEGPKAVADALRAGWVPIALAMSRSAWDRATLFEPELPSSTMELELSDALFHSLSDTPASQGVLALFHRPPEGDVIGPGNLIVALDGVQDPGNAGTIVRLAAAFDVRGLIFLPGCADPLSSKAIRASAGSILSVPFAFMTHAELVACGLPLYAADATGEPVDPPAGDAVLILGSEGRGIHEDLLSISRRISVRTSGRVESLNVAMTAAILLSRSFSLR